MYAASQREARERAALADLAQVVNSTLEINAVYERCAQQVRRLLHGEGLTVTSLSDDLGTLTYEYSDNAGGPGRQTGHVEDLASSPLREVVTSQKGIVFGERATGQSGHRLYDQSASAGVRSMVAVPLLSNNRVIGTLDLESRDDNAYGPEELALAERAGALVANAIANAQLYQQALQLAEERELRARAEAAARELERVAEAKSEFLSTVSHELKTPLTSIIAFTDILLRQRANALDEKDVRHLEVIKRNGRRLSLLIEDLLDVSRIDMGTLKVERDWFDIREVLSDLQESFGPILEPKRQTLTVSVPPDALVAFADRNRITQVVSNLLSNASKYSPADRSIEVRARDDDGKVHVEIQDHGYGISAEDQAKLFTPFFRVSNDTVRAIPGTGLGLVIAKGIIELHGGQVSLESEPGKGTTVRFHILREPAAAQDSEKVA
jgi:signal transduction histidine kinase